MIQKIQISIASANVLGLKKIKVNTLPTTCYIMTYSETGCKGGCAFCSQNIVGKDNNLDKKKNRSNVELLSRVSWPVFDITQFYSTLEIESSKNIFKRVCIQVLNYEGFEIDTLELIKTIHSLRPDLKISIATPLVSLEKMKLLKDAGLERICFAFDACTKELFLEIKPNSSWRNIKKGLGMALDVFGDGYVTTHYIVGLGETEKQLILKIHETVQMHILPGIFRYFQIKGTLLAKKGHPEAKLLIFRKIQLARYLLLINLDNIKRFIFENDVLTKIKGFTEDELTSIINKQVAFKTAGCPDCNRPNYTSRPGKEHSGFPRDLTDEEKSLIYNELKHLVE